MALDHRYPFAAQALPTPNDTPYETPSRGISSSWQGSSSPYSNSSPAPFPPSEESYFPRQHAAGDDGDDKRYSTHDPRRLTPNLGISFVSQIHSLKKELESKDTLVESLEESLHQAKAETDQLSDELDDKKVEVKSLKHQMQSLEHDMLQALEDMANQRDNAVESVADTRKRLEASKKKTRAQEEDAIRTQELWETDKQTWEDKKQKLESKVYVVEERLKTMVAEMLAVQSIGENRLGVLHDVDEGMRDTWMVKGTDTWNNRTTSGQSNRSLGDVYEGKESANFRTSRLSGLHAQGGSNMSDLSLAEELKLDEDEEEDAEGDLEDHSMFSPNALPEEYEVANRYSEDEKARKIMGFHSDKKGERLRDESSRQCSTDIIDDYYNFSRRHSAVSYTDTATQFTPPTSPILQAQQMDFISERPVEQTERAANQSRKRVAIPQIFVEQTSAARHETAKPSRMISVGCQTVEQPQQPPIIAEAISPSASAMEAMKFASTQTSEDALPVSKPADSRLAPLPLDVPVIAIHPPASRPPSSHNSVVLPPRTKNAACQVVIEMPRSLRSMAVQTEEIRIDKRPIRIPPRLQPSVFSPSILVRSVERWTQTSQTPQESAPAPPIRKVRSPTPTLKDQIIRRPNSLKSRDAYREHNDNGPLDSKQRSGPRRPIRTESIFAGFDDVNCIENDGIQTDLSDDDFATAAPIRKTLSKVQNSWKLVPQSKVSVSERLESASEETGDQKGNDAHEIPEAKAKAAPKSTSKSFQTKPSKGSRRTLKNSQEADIRRKALTANGIAEHTQRTRSPSAPDLPGKKSSMVAPPFPVPTRASSRKIPISASDGAGSPTPYTTSFFTARRGQEPSKPPAKRRILRKTQSAATVVKEPTRRPPPPPPISASSTIPASPKPSLPSRNQFVLPYDSVAELPKQLSTVARPEPHAGSATIESPGQQTSVVDAIAQTMVGEWMWKYVRKRTSFGITENPQVEFEMGRNGEAGSSSGARHKRWVWLAPYENAVIWSSKQPTSGPALLGKGGRKLTIQSVLDVKDDTPLPKNAGSQPAFDRSILILTPRRALKFTAVSRERHYIWLTALSFLSHSTQGMDDLANAPPLPQQEYQAPPSQASASGFRRTPARDSLALNKAKSRPSVGVHSYSTPPGELERENSQETRMGWTDDAGALSDDAAEPPQVPRIAAHARKRSSTGSRPVPLSAFHSYPSNSMAMSSSFSVQNPTSRDKYDRYMPSAPNSMQNTMGRRVTDSLIAPVVPDNFFDPVGTVRMEAFVDKGVNDVLEVGKTKKEARSYRTRQGRKKDLKHWGVDESVGSSEMGGVRLRSSDPFSGF